MQITLPDNYFKFLGTAGARFVVARQLRYSGGVFIRMGGKNILLDPGPGALVRCARSRPPIDVTALDAVVLTHLHIDHANDVNIIIDAMTGGGLAHRGILFAPADCLSGEDKVVLNYVRGFLDDIRTLQAKRTYRLGELRFSTSIRHRHPVETYGIMFRHRGRKISFMSDTKYFPGLLDSYRGSDILVMNVLRSAEGELSHIMHLSVDDVRRVVAELKPRKTILTHLGMTMVRFRPLELSRKLSRELGTEVIVATDGMTVPL